MNELKFSYFQLTFGQEETYHHPEKTYERLKRFGYSAIELTPPKGQYGSDVSMEQYISTHKKLRADYDLQVSCLNDCWGQAWDPHSPRYKTLTEEKTADLAVRETKETIDMAHELGAPYVTVAVATHEAITAENVDSCSLVAVDALRRMSDHAGEKGVRLVFEATNHLEMGKFVNTVANHRRLINATGSSNIGIQIDWFHANFEELGVYEAVIDAQPLLWHLHFRDSNSLTPGYGNVDFKSIIRALKRTGYAGFCTIESSPMFPESDTACRDGIEYLKLMEHIVDLQLRDDFPNGYAVPNGV